MKRALKATPPLCGESAVMAAAQDRAQAESQTQAVSRIPPAHPESMPPRPNWQPIAQSERECADI